MKAFAETRALVRALLSAVFLLSGARLALAEDAPPAASVAPATSVDAEATHNELRAMRDAVMQAWQRRDLDAMLLHVDPDVVVTWQNGDVSRGPEAVKKFYQDMFEKDGGLIADMKSEIKVDELAILHDANTAVAFGSIHDDITFKKSLAASFVGAGEKLALDSRWSATALRKNGAWKIASYHVSANLFSNPVMSLAVKSTQRMFGAGGLLVGVLIMLIVMWLRRGKRKPASA